MTPIHRRTLMPRRLLTRAILILLVPVVVLQLVVGAVFFERHYQRVTQQMTRSVALELTRLVDLVESADSPTAATRRVQAVEHPLTYELTFLPEAGARTGTLRERFDLTGTAIVTTLAEEIDRPLSLDLASLPRTVVVEIGTSAGVLRAEIPRARMSVSNPHQLLVLMVMAAGILTAIAVLFLRNQVRPIRRLAEAAEAFGKGRSLPFRPAGAEEIRRAGAAFLSMRARIERQIEQRTRMLSGVSHDLRTPLTRMKLTLAMMDESEDVEQLRTDVNEMEAMLADFLAFARGSQIEDVGEVDPVGLARTIAENVGRSGKQVEILVREENHGPTAAAPRVSLRSGAVSRALQNLVSNAIRHGGRVRLTVRILPKTVDFVVEDDGPGIPSAERERALQAFARLDAARNLDRGGSVGLGLSIALDIARAHGGTLELSDSAELGGLRATLRLPR